MCSIRCQYSRFMEPFFNRRNKFINVGAILYGCPYTDCITIRIKNQELQKLPLPDNQYCRDNLLWLEYKAEALYSINQSDKVLATVAYSDIYLAVDEPFPGIFSVKLSCLLSSAYNLEACQHTIVFWLF